MVSKLICLEDSVLIDIDIKDIFPTLRNILLEHTTQKLFDGSPLEALHASQVLIELINRQNEILEGVELVKSLYFE